ncbi:sugar phosphate isomerase/epimerase [Paraglaciecola aquimarina]|uniref:Sugar phosphate isomerase/epimerase n=1 Tax=Paraglaciecola algarum TaxID=3050085 RepID=A0ABS9D3A9_9ALTE|nr:sugar phosphate isomerase/epimerase family protein [Paraglaciecola sp. G1-23]MCF2947405.1 sugar phosphate isomerase/epimerase [Paraglaciecola sp. G1-23]
MQRRTFVKALSSIAAASAIPPLFCNVQANSKSFDIALSQYSFHRSIFGDSQKNYQKFIQLIHSDPDAVLAGPMDPREIVVIARKLGVGHVDLANILWFGHGQDKPWLNQFKTMAKDNDVGFTCLMTDELGQLGSSDKKQRLAAIEKHKPWVETAAEIGCFQMRVNAYGDGTYLEQLEQNAESMIILAEYTQNMGIELVIENHGHPSSNAAWLAMLIEKVNHPNLGVYTDLDNFFMGGWNHSPQRRYDRTQGLIDLAPYTRGVSAKTHGFKDNGQELTIDYFAALKILTDAGFSGFVCGEFEGKSLPEMLGSQATLDLLRKTRKQIQNS